MVTKDQAINAHEFHYGECTHKVGPRGGITEHSEKWRRNGKTQIWKTRFDSFRVPVKYGLYGYAQITESNAHMFHVAENCPLLLAAQKIAPVCYRPDWRKFV